MLEARCRAAIIGLLVVLGPALCQNGGELAIRLRASVRENRVSFEVSGLDRTALAGLKKASWKAEEWSALFAVYAGKDPKNPPLAGDYRLTDTSLIFDPRFPPTRGVRYRAVFDPARLPVKPAVPRERIEREFQLPGPVAVANAGAGTAVREVYPTRNVLPENQLKFYIHFSAPMSRGDSYRFIFLLDAAGKQVHDPFLELGEELWDERQTRFTLFFDPGRIKRGLKPREDLGPALEEGKSYTLVIDRDWPDAEGRPLKESFRKSFKVGPPDDQPIDPKTWKVQPPRAGTTEPLTVTFPEPLDHAMLHRVITVTDSSGESLGGQITVTKEETAWQFTPRGAWQAGRHELSMPSNLEDLAGNKIGRAFEVDIFQQVERESKPQVVKLAFDVK